MYHILLRPYSRCCFILRGFLFYSVASIVASRAWMSWKCCPWIGRRYGRRIGPVARTAWLYSHCCSSSRPRSSSAHWCWSSAICGLKPASYAAKHDWPAASYAVVGPPTYSPVDAALLASSAPSPSPSPSAGRPITFSGPSYVNVFYWILLFMHVLYMHETWYIFVIAVSVLTP